MSPKNVDYSPAIASASIFFNRFFHLSHEEAKMMGFDAVLVLKTRDSGSFGRDLLEIYKVLNFQTIDTNFELFHSFTQLVDVASGFSRDELIQIENGMHPVLTELRLTPYGLAETTYELSMA